VAVKLTRAQVAQRYNRNARTIDRWVLDAEYAKMNFPAPMMIGRSPMWDEADLEKWERSLPRQQRPGDERVSSIQ
jgi:predicted DNA-binding transcriptional regulator AlpA